MRPTTASVRSSPSGETRSTVYPVSSLWNVMRETVPVTSSSPSPAGEANRSV